MSSVADIPNSWHYIGRSSDFSSKPRNVSIAEKTFVAYRLSSGEVIVLYAYCSHMGAELAKGHLRKDCLVCPFHGWEYDSEGQCVRIPATDDIPSFATQQKFAVRERHGLVFMFYGKEPLFELPFFDDCDPNDFFCDRVFKVYQNAPWYIVPANAFDMPHFTYVHQRHLVKTPQFDFPNPYVARIINSYRIAATTLSDRIIRTLYGNEATMYFTSWAGNFTLGVMQFGKLRHYMMILIEPVKKNQSISNIFVFSDKASRGKIYRGLKRIPMRIKSIFSQRFFQVEADGFENVHLNVNNLIDTDALLKRYLTWLTLLNGDSAKLKEFTRPQEFPEAEMVVDRLAKIIEQGRQT